jgi:hypothetical protein
MCGCVGNAAVSTVVDHCVVIGLPLAALGRRWRLVWEKSGVAGKVLVVVMVMARWRFLSSIHWAAGGNQL